MNASTYQLAAPSPCSASRHWLFSFDQPDQQEELLIWIARISAPLVTDKALFSFIGSATQATFGIYDHKQQVYVTHQENGDLDVTACHGVITAKAPEPEISAKIILAGHDGNLRGGQLFSPTMILNGQLTLSSFTF